MKNKKYYLSHMAGLCFLMLLCISTVLTVVLFLQCLGFVTSSRDILYVSLGALFFVSLTLYCWYRFVYKAYRETEKIYRLFAGGYIHKGIYEIRYAYSPELKAVFDKLKAHFESGEQLNLSKRQAEFMALQNQINPHFLYNTLEGIRGEAIYAGIPIVADMTEALAVFFRYTITNINRLVSLEDEIANVENYCEIQKYRFGERLNLKICYDEEEENLLLKCHLPKLTLQPIVENAIYHGIERRLGPGQVLIKITQTSKRLIITVSDTGAGMDEKRLNEILDKLNKPSQFNLQDESQGGIALINVNNRIKLLFGEEYGINIYSSVNVGTDVEITVPVIYGETEGGADEN